ncbi:MAG: RAD55 family ATPase [Haloferacaceae archaeon]
MVPSRRKFSTGLPPLNRKLDGGIPHGTLVAFTAPTRTQSELFLHQLATNQSVHSVSTTCPEESEFYDRLPDWTSADDVSFQYVEPTEFHDTPESVLDGVDPETYVVVDNADPFERIERRQEYLTWLDALAAWMRANESVAVLHCTTNLADGATPRWRRLTEKRADFILEMKRITTSREIQTQLVVAKARGERALTDTADGSGPHRHQPSHRLRTCHRTAGPPSGPPDERSSRSSGRFRGGRGRRSHGYPGPLHRKRIYEPGV